MTVPCAHTEAVRAAWFTCTHPETVDTSTYAEPPGRVLCLGLCGATYWENQ